MSLRQLERATIRQFVRENSRLFGSRVLDFGCGKSPYRQEVEKAGAEYDGFDRVLFPGNVSQEDHGRPVGPYTAVLCTQVVQYVEAGPEWLVDHLYGYLEEGGWLVMTGPTNWPVVEKEDLWRLTPAAVDRLLTQRHFCGVAVTVRAHVAFEGEVWPLGWGAVAQRC